MSKYSWLSKEHGNIASNATQSWRWCIAHMPYFVQFPVDYSSKVRWLGSRATDCDNTMFIYFKIHAKPSNTIAWLSVLVNSWCGESLVVLPDFTIRKKK